MYIFSKDSLSRHNHQIEKNPLVYTSENISLYAVSKGCLSALTRAMSLEYAGIGIRVNSILPGADD